MTAPEATDETVRVGATTFFDGAFADAAGALTEAGRGAVVASFPDEFQQEETMSAADALEAYWRGLYGQYGPPERVGDVSAGGDTAIVELLFEGGTATPTAATRQPR